MHADYIWDVSKAMQPARVEAGLNLKKSAQVIHVPNGLYPNQIKASPASEVDKHSMVYMGTLGQENGPDVAIQALALVKKKFPDAKLHIIGGTKQDFLWLRKIIEKINIEKSIYVHGFVAKNSDMSNIIRKCAVGLAPYRDIPGSLRYYADAGKIRVYAAAGISIVSSQVPPLGIDAADRGAALRVHDDPESFANAIIDIFSDKKLYLKLRKNAMIFAKDNTWDNSFTNAFKRM
jgi:glycosyltransferase involved in cell wall biosynthesis